MEKHNRKQELRKRLADYQQQIDSFVMPSIHDKDFEQKLSEQNNIRVKHQQVQQALEYEKTKHRANHRYAFTNSIA